MIGVKGVVVEKRSGPTAVRGKPGHYTVAAVVRADAATAGYALVDVTWQHGTDKQVEQFTFRFFAKGARYTTPPMGKLVQGEQGEILEVMPATSR